MQELEKNIESLSLNKAPTFESIAKGLKNNDYQNIIVMTGAGISVGAGLSDFRSPKTGFFEKMKKLNLPSPESVFTISYFLKDPKPFYSIAREFIPSNLIITKMLQSLEEINEEIKEKSIRVKIIELRSKGWTRKKNSEQLLNTVKKVRYWGKKFNTTDLLKNTKSTGRKRKTNEEIKNFVERKTKKYRRMSCKQLSNKIESKLDIKIGLLLRVYTQNVDTLERKTGLSPEKLVEAHGSFATATCLNCGKKYIDEDIKSDIIEGNVPKCSKCNDGVIKPDITFYSEELPSRFNLVEKDFPRADILIVIGTSLKVMPLYSLIRKVKDSCPRVLINFEEVAVHGTDSWTSFISKGFQFNENGNLRDVKKIGNCQKKYSRNNKDLWMGR
ncbi:nad-dependent protein deacetylase sirtuin-2 [Anaeramoeba flamelloides]|uniref:Nad-dependent protein deacetylase sirtuin-2 n=1 Tax=Anaeramoeba flamelloides TaxID=1746091 RepID=A0AAV8A1R8_9EUKA|nr:nad-dependent protein deacetylase sirtuin-2 [Anaeramoeba flamelloides]